MPRKRVSAEAALSTGSTFVFDGRQAREVLAFDGLPDRGRKWQRGRLNVADHKRALPHDNDLARFWEGGAHYTFRGGWLLGFEVRFLVSGE
jgi:hypothetical protein